MEKLPEDIEKALTEICLRCERENSYIRRRQIRTWKKLEKFWHGVQYLFWSETSDDWLSPADIKFNTTEDIEDGPFYDYVINIYRAHGEAVIAALASSLPAVRFVPDDADSEEDLMTSKTFSKIADLVVKHLKGKQLLLRVLFNLWNQGLVAAHMYPRTSKDYGTVKVPKTESVTICPQCEFKAKETDNLTQCPNCQVPLTLTTELVGFEDTPKNRTCVDLYGPLYVKIPYEAVDLESCGYLILTLDQPREFLQSIYPDIREAISRRSSSEEDMYERVGRAPSVLSGYNLVDSGANLCTHKRIWLRPWQFESAEEGVREQLKKRFPQGVQVSFVGETFAGVRGATLDEEWKICKAGLSQHIHSDPIGQPLMPVQEMVNLHANLTQETIEHGIPSSFADPDVLDFETYGKHEARPGIIYPARRRPGESLQQGFYESSRASLSKEVGQFSDRLEKAGQFVVGSFPSIYGGPGEGASRTASEYSQSRQMALQRLSIIWTFVQSFWAELIGSCSRIYANNMIADERFVQVDGKNYINVWIRRSELTGRIGSVEPESAEDFPLSLAQKQTLLLKLIELNNEFLNAALFDPNNRSIVAQALSFPDFNIPGEKQRIKQKTEIQQILEGNTEVQPEMEVDDHGIHMEVLVDFMTDTVGLEIKRTEPEKYQMLMQHFLIHKEMMLMGAQQNAPQPPPEDN